MLPPEPNRLSPARRDAWYLRALLAFVLASLPPAAIVVLASGQGAMPPADQPLARAARQAAGEQAALLGQAGAWLAGIAHLPAVADGAPADCAHTLAGLRGAAPWALSLAVYGPSGAPVCADSRGGAGAGIGDRGYFQAVLGTRRFVLSDLVIGQALPLPMVLAVQPVLDADGSLRRVIVAGLDPAELGALGRPAMPEAASAMLLVDSTGTIFAAQPPNPGSLGGSLAGSPLEVTLRGTGEATVPGPDGMPIRYGFAPIPGTRAMLVLRAAEGLATPAPMVMPLAYLGASLLGLGLGALTLGALRRPGRAAAAAPPAPPPPAAAAGELAEAPAARLGQELLPALQALHGQAGTLGRDPALGAEQRSLAAQIAAGSEALVGTLREIQDLAALEAGRIRLAPVPLHLATLIEACGEVIRPAAAAKSLAFGMELAPLPADWVAADPLRLRQLLLHLLAHAIRTTARGEVVLRVAPLPEAGMVRLEVADSGPGMTAPAREALLRQLATAGAARSGLDLGLALIGALVGLMRGRFDCETAPGEGTLWRLDLPLAEAAAGTVPPSRSLVPLGQPLRLLLADDVASNREVTRTLLEGAGHQVMLVQNGAEALAAAGGEDWDAVLLDVHMPVMDGRTAARRIREIPGPRGRVPILAVTASATGAEVAECLAAGMDGHLEKPLRPWEMQNVLAILRARGDQSLATTD